MLETSVDRSPLRRLHSGLLLLLIASNGTSESLAQGCAGSSLPQTAAPVTQLDPMTALLGTFDSEVGIASGSGPGGIKSTMSLAIAPAGGFFGSPSLAVPSQPSVAIFPSDGFPTARGTIELWAKPNSAGPSRGVLFSLRGATSLDGDPAVDLVFGETTTHATQALSRVLFDGDLAGATHAPLTFASFAPRGVAVGDVSGDGILDLLVAQNFGDLLPNPTTSAPGEVHVWFGPFVEGSALGSPDRMIEVARPQGLALADLDRNGTLDFVCGSYDPTTEPLVGYGNDGAGNFKRLKFELEIAACEAIALGDVDRDGVLDVLYASFDAGKPSRVALGRSPLVGVYELGGPNGISFQLSDAALGASLADIDGDGWLDAILALPYSGTGAIAIHRNRGDGSFSAVPDFLLPSIKPFTLNATRDVDQDGALDIVVANWRQGPISNPVSTVWFGPIGSGVTKSREFRIDDAVAQAIGDLDGNGTDDLVFHSSTASASAAFLLDWDGLPSGGFDAFGRALPSFSFPSAPTAGNPSGEGAGMAFALPGTATYGSVHVEPNSFEIGFEAGRLRFRVRDKVGRTRSVEVPFPPPADSAAVNGFHHIQAEWDSTIGRIELRVGHPQFGSVAVMNSPAFTVGAVAPVFRLGTDSDNQARASGWFLDGLRVSSGRRSEFDLDHDGIQDDFDVCRYVANPLQQDANHDGVGDACAVCATDLGFGGPGSIRLEICGQTQLGTSSGALVVRCGLANAPVLLVSSAVALPTPFQGGVLVPALPVQSIRFGFDASGTIVIPFSGIGFPVELVVQAIGVDLGQPLGASLSNALRIELP